MHGFEKSENSQHFKEPGLKIKNFWYMLIRDSGMECYEVRFLFLLWLFMTESSFPACLLSCVCSTVPVCKPEAIGRGIAIRAKVEQ